jgi:tRNA pseudouridine38/39 synthase
MINTSLPSEIQVIGWAACSSLDFSARFNCVNRTYQYFFPRGDLSLELINEGGSYLVGEHDFRNFCKMDIRNGVVNYHRRITSVTADVIQTDQSDEIKRFQILVKVMYSRRGHISETSCMNLSLS